MTGARDQTSKGWRLGALLGILFAACFWDILAGARTFYFRDFSHFGYPLAAHWQDRFQAGQLPLWNPYNNCGLPFLAQWNTMVLYPGSLLVAILPAPWGVNVFCLAHLVLGGFGMRRLMRGWTGSALAADFSGLLFAFNGLALNFVMWPNNSAAWGWMPWVVHFGCVGGRGRDSGIALARAALAGAMQMLTGAPEVILFTWMLTGVLGVAMGRWRGFVFTVRVFLLAAGVASPQLWPFLELYFDSHRTGGNFATQDWAMGWKGLLNFIAPLAGAQPTEQGVWLQDGQKWTSSYYVGGLCLAFAAVGVRGKVGWSLASLTVLSILLATGVATMGVFRYPIKWIVPAVFCLIGLGGLGLAKLEGDSTAGTKGLFVGALALLLVVGAVFRGAGVVWMALGAIVFWAMIRRPRINGMAAAFLALVALDIRFHMSWQNPTVEAALLAKGGEASVEGRSFLTLEAYNELRSRLLPDAAKDLAIRRAALLQNLNLIDGMAKLDGFFSLYPQREREFRQALYLSELNDIGPALDFLGVRRFSMPGNILEWQERSSALPLVTGGQTPVFLREGQILRVMLSPDFDPRRTVYFWNGYSNLLAGAAGTFREAAPFAAKLVSHRPGKMTISVSRSTPDFAVIAESYDKNWRAEADGKPARIFRANYNFMAVEVPAGAATINLRYRSGVFEGGLTMGAGALALCGFLVSRKRGDQTATV